jgi:sigma-E factor negative regulatory protein RseC
MEKRVEHEGIVASVSGNTMMVRIVSSPACSVCAAGRYCVASENKDKDICVEMFSGDFVLGEKVMVVMQQLLGFKALCIVYLIPFVAVLLTLFMVYHITHSELVSGLSALAILFPYYLMVKLMNRQFDFDKIFKCSVEKLN